MVDLPALQMSESKSEIKASVQVNLEPVHLIKGRLMLILGMLPTPSFYSVPEVIDEFRSLCPEPSPRQQATFGGRRFVVLGTGESVCKTYKITLAAELPAPPAESLSDRTPPKLLAFVSYGPYYESEGSITKNQSLLKFGTGASTGTLAQFKAKTEIIQMDPTSLLRQLVDFDYRRAFLPTAQSFLLAVDIEGQVWSERRFPVATLPSEIVIGIASYLPLPSVQSLAQAIPDFVPHLALEPTRRISAILEPYFPDMPTFVSLLKKIGSLVAASTVLYALMGRDETWEPNDLDLVVPAVAEAEVHGFLHEQGWTVDEAAAELKKGTYTTIYNDMMLKVYTKGKSKIDLVCPSDSMAVIDYLYTYHSTPPMAFFTGNSLGHLFPRLTLEHKAQRSKLGRTHRSENDGDAGRAKYAGRGYTFIAGLAVPTDVDKNNVIGSIATPLYRASVHL
ncbi:hypothetical protein RQP46_001099 [Phenoliferia psychrophenolica]